ncbi:M20/M25/M40 family metallo-hydrolase [Variovorax brevis]|uniref:M20/M25/M40 family metallo-hydrolase n=1 Tax=Variovorax brevis TaxID=3053503 RepID=UPI00336568EE
MSSFRISCARRLAGASMALALCATSHAQAVLSPADAERFAKASFPEYLELLAIPSDAAQPPDIQRNAAWLEKAFQKRGFQTRTLANEGKPLVYAELGPQVPGRKTVLYYMHFDAQPVKASEWKTDPWQPVLKARDAAGEWAVLPIERLQQSPIDPEWRVFARASADDKGPIVMFLAAMDALSAAGRKPDINVKVLLDSEEEKGSPKLHIVMREHEALLKSDGMVVHDGAMPASNEPGINFGNRGSVAVDLTVFGATSAAHSGTYGNVVPNPALNLAKLLASMKDADGKVTVAGYYDRVKISEEDRRQMAPQAPPAGSLEKRFGVARLDRISSNPVESVQYPSLDLLGIQSGGTGPTAANAIPATAVATLNMRTVPETPPDYLFDLLRRHVQAQGYHVIEGKAPTAEERARYPLLASMSLMAYPSTATAARIDMDSPLATWVVKGVTAPRNIAPQKSRMGGSTLPMSGAVDVLKTGYVVVPLVNADNNQHAFDENLRLGNYLEGVRTVYSMLTTPF